MGAARPHRELAARPALGDLGRVPPARGRGSDDVRPDDGRQLDLHRYAGDPPGDVPDVRSGGRAALRLGGSQRPDDPDGRSRRDGRRAAARGDDGGRGDPVRRGRPEPDRAAARDAVSRRGRRLAGRRRRTCARRGGRRSRGLGRSARERGDRLPGAGGARGALRPRYRPDRCARSAHGLRARRGPASRRPRRCATATRRRTSGLPASRSSRTSGR